MLDDSDTLVGPRGGRCRRVIRGDAWPDTSRTVAPGFCVPRCAGL
jgi:hypothetical protein